MFLLILLLVMFLVAPIGARFPPPERGGPCGATGSDAAAPADATGLFERARRAVFIVETEAGHGSGFLVDAQGLILTNDHVVGNSDYVAIGIDPVHKYSATVVARDPVHDLALLRLHPEAVAGVRPLSLVNPRTGPAGGCVEVGERVFALGSVPTGEGVAVTSGIVSRLTGDIILADLTVNPGASGGPLLNLHGEVLGLNTFLMRADVGPGLAGVVPAHFARQLLMTAAATIGPARSLVQLPTPPTEAYPPALLESRAAAIRDPQRYRARMHGSQIDLLTPPVIHFYARRSQRGAAAQSPLHGIDGRTGVGGRESYGWREATSQLDAIVAIRVGPVAGSGDASPASVRKLRLLRDGMDVIPIVPGRFCRVADAARNRKQGVECTALYQYRPEAFAPDAALELHIYTEGRSKSTMWKLPPRLVKGVWADFEPYFRGQIDGQHGHQPPNR